MFVCYVRTRGMCVGYYSICCNPRMLCYVCTRYARYAFSYVCMVCMRVMCVCMVRIVCAYGIGVFCMYDIYVCAVCNVGMLCTKVWRACCVCV